MILEFYLPLKYTYSKSLKGLFLVIYIFFNTSTNAQPNVQNTITDSEIKKYLGISTFDSLLEQTDYDREVLVFNSNSQINFHHNLKGFASLSKKIKQYAIEHNIQNLLIQFECIEIYFNLENNTNGYLERLLKLNQDANDHKNEWGATITQYLIALNYMGVQENFPKGILLFSETLDKIENDKTRNYFIRNLLLLNIEGYYYMMGDFRNALGYGRKINKSSINTAHITNANLMGVIYRNLNQLDSSNYFFNQELQYGLDKKDSALIVLSLGNLGENYYLQKKYAAALPLLVMDATYHYYYGFWGSASNAYLLIADIYISKDDLTNAASFLKMGHQCVINIKDHPTIELYKRHKLLYEILTKYYIAKSNSHFAALYFDSAKLATDTIANLRGSMTVLKTDGIFKHQKSEIQKLKLENDLNESKLNQLIFGIVFLVLALFSVFGFVQYRSKIKLEQISFQFEIEKIEKDLASARAELLQYLKDILPKEPIESEVNWKNACILTPEHWHEFKILFDKYCPGYHDRLSEKITNLTEAEVRLICLLKLNLTDNEMSNILGVNKNSVQQTRSRLKKKINIVTNEHLLELAQSI
jgi:DNA-binding CsgD family transcriptional regulator